tara:strand:+ start:1179 stop:2003 length:825 start_codon:yes stop_codon:yes gene_type:complete
MKISIYTQIFPRLETFFLEEWVEHHIKLGVDKIYLYDNGMVNTDSLNNKASKLPDEFAGVKWEKKPDADYFLDYTDNEIYEKLNQVVEKFNNQVTLVKWTPMRECPYKKRIFCQAEGYLHCISNNKSDWWIHIDPDEYLFSEKYDTIKEFLHINEEQKRYSLQLSQRVFESRTREKKVREIYEWGYDIRHTKTMVKSPNMRLDSNTKYGKIVHKMPSTLGDYFKVQLSDFRFNHYRGMGQNRNGPNDKAYRSKHKISSFDKIDETMKRFLENEK